MFDPIFTDMFILNYQFKEDISEDYINYLRDQVIKIRINQVKRTVEVWARQPETGPMHDLIGWLTHLSPTLKVTEMDRNGNTARILEFKDCSLIDHELIYSYDSIREVARNYMTWSYTDSSF